jgi:hypothetical protein
MSNQSKNHKEIDATAQAQAAIDATAQAAIAAEQSRLSVEERIIASALQSGLSVLSMDKKDTGSDAVAIFWDCYNKLQTAKKHIASLIANLDKGIRQGNDPATKQTNMIIYGQQYLDLSDYVRLLQSGKIPCIANNSYKGARTMTLSQEFLDNAKKAN